MTYNPNIPTDLPAPADITTAFQTNFSQYQTVFSRDHVAINDSGQGKHKFVYFQVQSSDPTVVGDEICLYTKSITNTAGTAHQLFVRIPKFLPNNQPNPPIQVTYQTVNATVSPYQTFLPGGYVLYSGTVTGAVNVAVTVTLTPAPSSIVCVIATPTKFAGVGANPTAPIPVGVEVTGANTFTVNSAFPTGTGNFRWVAIGKQ